MLCLENLFVFLDFVQYCYGDSYEERQFNAELVKAQNAPAKETEAVDVDLKKLIEENKALIESLNGKLHIIFGNHCTKNRQAMYAECKNVVEICGYATMLSYKKYSFYLSHFPTNTGNYDFDRGLKGRIINLCGHSHYIDELEEVREGQLSYHVEMDAHDCYPVSIVDIILTLKHELGECVCEGKCENCKCKK